MRRRTRLAAGAAVVAVAIAIVSGLVALSALDGRLASKRPAISDVISQVIESEAARLQHPMESPDGGFILDPPPPLSQPKLSAEEAIKQCRAVRHCMAPLTVANHAMLATLRLGPNVRTNALHDGMLVWVWQWEGPCLYPGTALNATPPAQLCERTETADATSGDAGPSWATPIR